MAITYEVILCDQYGVHLKNVPDFYWLSWDWSANDVGAFQLALPLSYEKHLRMPDAIVQFTRHIDGVADAPPRAFIVELPGREQVGKRSALYLSGVDFNALIERRIIDYAAGSSYTSKTGVASNVMRDFILENLGSSATNADRILSSAIFSVQSAQGFGYSLTKESTRRNLLKTLQEIARTSYENGYPVYFDIVVTGYNPITLQWRAFQNVRGVDHSSTSATPMTLSIEDGQLTDVLIEEDYTLEKNVVRVAGAGRDDTRLNDIFTSDRWRAGPFARKEVLYSDSRITSSAGLSAAGYNVLTERKPRIRVSATLQQSASVIIGREFDLGDRIGINASGLGRYARFDAYVNKAKFRITRDSGEDAQVRLYSEAML